MSLGSVPTATPSVPRIGGATYKVPCAINYVGDIEALGVGYPLNNKGANSYGYVINAVGYPIYANVQGLLPISTVAMTVYWVGVSVTHPLSTRCQEQTPEIPPVHWVLHIWSYRIAKYQGGRRFSLPTHVR